MLAEVQSGPVPWLREDEFGCLHKFRGYAFLSVVPWHGVSSDCGCLGAARLTA